MQNIFIFTAGNDVGQRNLTISIQNPVKEELVLKTFSKGLQDRLKEIAARGNGFYAWGARDGVNNKKNWESMQTGDYVLCVYKSKYHYISKIIDKFNNVDFAREIWGADESGILYPFMYFLEKPIKINKELSELTEYLDIQYFGFKRIPDAKINKIIEDFQSVENFANKKFLNTDIEIIELLTRYYNEGTVFQSPEKAALYRIGSVNDAFCTVDRLTANAPENVNFSLIRQKKDQIREQGGKYLFRNISTTAAIRTTILQDGDLGLSVGRKEVLLLNKENNALTHFCELLKNLNVDTSSGRPKLYKPVMLKCVIEGIDSGDIRDNKIDFDWLLPRFLSNMEKFDNEAGPTQAAYAFFHLANELFWMLCYKNPEDRIVDPPSPAKIREKVRHATLKETYWRSLMGNENRQLALNVLTEHWLQSGEISFWWVNQGKSYQRAKDGGYIWAPQKNRRGNSEYHWESVRRVSKGDLVFSYANKEIRAISIAQCDGYESERPAGPLDDEWDKEGWRVDLKYYELLQPISIENIGPKIAELNLIKGPVNRTGGANQGYLYSLSKEAVEILSNQIDLAQFPEELEKMLSPSKKKTPIRTNRPLSPEERGKFLGGLIKFIDNSGFVFEPWQIACYVNALRTKPFVILAGVTGTGKSKLPSLVAEATGGNAMLIPVRPDWTDSSDILGYQDLQRQFRPGPLLELAKTALDRPEAYYISIIDEMNLARVEHYFAEVLSQIEDRRPNQNNGFQSGCLILQQLNNDDKLWQQVCIPANLGIVGTVNMDESAHGFSRKVLDRAFTLELSDIDLGNWQNKEKEIVSTQNWPVSFWWPRAIRLADLQGIKDEEKSVVENTISILNELNSFLVSAQLQVGYRTRDEVALFVLHAKDISEYFVTRKDEIVDPLDLSILMKILPRIVGGSSDIRSLIQKFLGWAYDKNPLKSDDEADETVHKWDEQGRGGSFIDAAYPRTAARLCLMWDRLRNEGFTSFWL